MDARNAQQGFFGKLAALVGAGVPLLTAIETAGGEVPPGALREAVERILAKTYHGQSLADSFGGETGVFSPEVLVLIETGEKMGDVDEKARAISEGIASGILAVPEAPAAEAVSGLEPLLAAMREAGATEAVVEPGVGGGRLRLRREGAWKPAPLPAGFDAASAAAAAEGREDVELTVSSTRRGPEIVLRLTTAGAADVAPPEDVAEQMARDRGVVLVCGLPGRRRRAARDALLATCDRESRKVGLVGAPTRVPGVTVYVTDPAALEDLEHLDVAALPEPRTPEAAEAAAGLSLATLVVIEVTAPDLESAKSRLRTLGFPNETRMTGTVVSFSE